MTRYALRPPRHRNLLAPWKKRLLFRTLLGLLLSGAAWLVLHYTMSTPDGLPNPLEAWLMKAHGLLAFFALFSLGTIASVHIPRGWKLRHQEVGVADDAKPQNRLRSALCLLGLWGGLVLTAYLMYYFLGEATRPLVGWCHAGLGVLLYGVLRVHSRRAQSIA